jgi:hypothetical protein
MVLFVTSRQDLQIEYPAKTKSLFPHRLDKDLPNMGVFGLNVTDHIFDGSCDLPGCEPGVNTTVNCNKISSGER